MKSIPTSLHRASITALVALSLMTTGCAATAGSQASKPSADTSPVAAAPTPEQLDLTGEWSWKDAPDPAQTMTATISADRIEIFWPSFEVGEEGEPLSGTMDKPLYWAGSFTAPEAGEDTYTFTSAGDVEAMKTSLLASGDSEKEFSFAEGSFSFDVTVQGETRTITLERD